MNTKPISSGHSASMHDQSVSVTVAGDAGAEPTTAAVLAAAERSLASTSTTARLDAELLLAFVTGRARSSLVAFPERPVPRAVLRGFEALVARRARGEPLAYLTGEREFFSLSLEVSAAVLVPRPETELLVELALERCAALRAPTVLDLGTGSGAIALAVKHGCPTARVTGTDVSAAALAVARANGVRAALEVRWLQSRWFEALEGERFDVIVSNPPYVRRADIAGALSFEPRLALDGGTSGLDAYGAILTQAERHLAVDGLLALEHGHEQRPALEELARRGGWRVVATRDDLAGRARALVLSAQEPA